MKTFNLILVLLILFPGFASADDCSIKRKDYKKICVELKEFTYLELTLVPDLATRLVFPFVLDKQSHSPPYEENLINGNVFTLTRNKGQNSLLLQVNTPESGGAIPNYMTDFFINVDGFNLNVRLKASNNLKKHVNEVLFNLSDDKREYLIEKAVKERTAALEKEVASKLSGVDEIADRRALGMVGLLSINEPETQSVKEKSVISLQGGEEIEVYVDHYKINNQFISAIVEVESMSPRKITLQDLQLVGYKDEESVLVDSEFRCKATKLSEDESTICVITTLDRGVLKYPKLSLNISTDRGQAELKW